MTNKYRFLVTRRERQYQQTSMDVRKDIYVQLRAISAKLGIPIYMVAESYLELCLTPELSKPVDNVLTDDNEWVPYTNV